MSWFYLVVAGLFEIVWAVAMKAMNGRLSWPLGIIVALGMTGSTSFLALSLRQLPLGTAYAAWTGIGAVGTVLIGVAVFRESLTPARLAFLLLIVVGIVGLRLTSSA